MTAQQLQDQEIYVRNMVYDPTNPIDGIFSAIEELVSYAAKADTPYTQHQIINMPYVILNRTGAFTCWILDWNQKPNPQKTWINFKIHFREAHHQLRKTTPLQQQQTPYQQANALCEMLDEFKKELISEIFEDEQPPPASRISEHSDASTIKSLQSEMSMMKEMINNMFHQVPPYMQIPPIPPSYQTWGQYPPTMCMPNGAPPPPMPYTMPHNPYMQVPPQPPKQNPPQQRGNNNQTRGRRLYYCWTHGVCNHASSVCKKPAAGHKTDATFQDNKDGSKKGLCKHAQRPTGATT